ncbi:hypothetical protein [Halobaculum sp. P14]|uniref:hypothetical protein n=1 Tax=Halobaculum sp. P14 TaxID=3421638 RepID=UPI003EB8C6BE
MPVDVVGWVTSHVTLVVTALLAVVVLYWLAEAVDEAEDHLEAASGFAGRAKQGTGGTLNVLLVAFVSVVGWAATTFSTAAEFWTMLVDVAPQMPVLTASVITIGLGAVGLSDVIVLEPLHFIGISAVLVALGLLYRRGFGRDRGDLG